MTSIGIDFGTTNSVVATWSPEGAEALAIDDPLNEWATLGFDRVMPSVFARSPDGKALFGWAAKGCNYSRFEAVKRLFATQQESIIDDSGNTFSVEEVATMLFAELKAATARQGIDATKAVVTIPANSRGLARHRTKLCAGMAGLDVRALINEPTAAAMAYASKNPGDQQLLVFDWGGGTLDVTILRAVSGVFLEQASMGLPTKGGLDFDSRLREVILKTVPDRSFWTNVDRWQFDLDVELAKINLSERKFTIVQLPGGDNRKIAREMFEDSIETLISEARHPIEQCLRDVGAGFGSIDSVVMVGGTSKIPAVRRFVTELLQLEPEVDVDPMTAVGEGAAIAAAILSGDLKDNNFAVSTEHALGTVAASRQSRTPEFSVLIPRNHRLPAKETKTYSPVHAGQETVVIDVIEGDPEKGVDHPDNIILKEWTVPLPGQPGDPDRSLEVTYEYDLDGILHVLVTDSATDVIMLEDVVSYGIANNKFELVRIAQQANRVVADREMPDNEAPDKVSTSTTTDPESVLLLQRAKVKVIPFLDGDEASEIREAVRRLENAADSDRHEAMTQLETLLAPYIFLF